MTDEHEMTCVWTGLDTPRCLKGSHDELVEHPDDCRGCVPCESLRLAVGQECCWSTREHGKGLGTRVPAPCGASPSACAGVALARPH